MMATEDLLPYEAEPSRYRQTMASGFKTSRPTRQSINKSHANR